MILDEVNARIKLAEAKTAEDPSNFDSFPGAENDKPVAEETKKPDPEVKDEGPASRTETTGAEPGSDVPLQQDHLYEADEPVLTPEKKPAESDDANAKEAADKEVTKVASEILDIIKGTMSKTAAAKKTPASKPEKKADDMNNNKISLESRILDKIASVRMAKQAGANDASTLIKAAADYNRGAADAEALIQKVAQAMADAEAAQGGAEQTPEEAGAADAEAAIADAAAADAGADADAASDAAGAAGGEEDPVTPEEVVEAVNELVEEGQISQEDAAEVIGQLGADTGDGQEGGEDMSEDELAEGIAQAIESGELSEEEAQQLVQELVDAGADESLTDEVSEGDDGTAAAEEAGAADAAEAAGAADAEAALADAAQKEAAAHEANQIERYQRGFIQKCAEFGCDPQRVAQYIQARLQGAR